MLKFAAIAFAAAVSMEQAEESLIEDQADEMTVPEHEIEGAELDETDPELIQEEEGEGENRVIVVHRRKRWTTISHYHGTKYYWKRNSRGHVYRKKCTKGILYGYYCQHHWHLYRL